MSKPRFEFVKTDQSVRLRRLVDVDGSCDRSELRLASYDVAWAWPTRPRKDPRPPALVGCMIARRPFDLSVEAPETGLSAVEAFEKLEGALLDALANVRKARELAEKG